MYCKQHSILIPGRYKNIDFNYLCFVLALATPMVTNTKFDHIFSKTIPIPKVVFSNGGPTIGLFEVEHLLVGSDHFWKQLFTFSATINLFSE
jgi:hypothetical protein